MFEVAAIPKRCSRCRAVKPTTEFWKHSRAKDGLQDRCKECKVAATRSHREGNREEWRTRGREERHRKPERTRELNAKHKDKDRSRVNKQVWAAIQRGDLIPSETCERCGAKPPRMHSHHDDYSKPLRVEWVCPSCHRKVHEEKARAEEECGLRDGRI